MLAGLFLALSLGAAGLTVFLSQYSGNYIAMPLKAVPLFVAAGAVLGSWLLDMPFTFRSLGNGAVCVRILDFLYTIEMLKYHRQCFCRNSRPIFLKRKNLLTSTECIKTLQHAGHEL